MKSRLIIVSVRFNSIAGRDMLSGLFSYNEPGYRWRFRIIQSEEEFSAETIRGALDEGADGFALTFTGNAESLRALSGSGKPIVHLGPKRASLSRNQNAAACIRNDNRSIGIMGGEYLASLGKFASFGFIHSKPGFHFTEERHAGFKSYLKGEGHTCGFEFWPVPPEGSEADISALASWMAALPKPAAVMAACDRRAMHAAAAAKRAGVKIPSQISLLGVDNDELLAENLEPPLTSILPGHFEMGLSMAKELARLFAAKGQRKHRIIRVPPNRVVERESTAPLTPAMTLVHRAMDFISARATKGLSVAEVVKHSGCSRNLLDLRFWEIRGMTVRAAIEKTRLASVLNLVETTNRSVAAIASQCGFGSANRLSHLFRQRFGKSIREWRETCSSPSREKPTQMKKTVHAGEAVAERDTGHRHPLRKAAAQNHPAAKERRKRK